MARSNEETLRESKPRGLVLDERMDPGAPDVPSPARLTARIVTGEIVVPEVRPSMPDWTLAQYDAGALVEQERRASDAAIAAAQLQAAESMRWSSSVERSLRDIRFAVRALVVVLSCGVGALLFYIITGR